MGGLKYICIIEYAQVMASHTHNDAYQPLVYTALLETLETHKKCRQMLKMANIQEEHTPNHTTKILAF